MFYLETPKKQMEIEEKEEEEGHCRELPNSNGCRCVTIAPDDRHSERK
jgi:hypothetical protein